ncbi:DinB family protein [Rathayibacter sp. CAU 1779]
MADRVDKPNRALADERDILVGFLDYDRSAVGRKLQALSDADASTSVIPSGWSMIELAWHLAAMERRWLRWSFLGEALQDPYPDADDSGSWRVPAGLTVAEVLDTLRTGGEATRRIVAEHDLDERAHLGGKYTGDDDQPLPTLRWILTYVVQEYSRHLGHLDIARELIDGETGE